MKKFFVIILLSTLYSFVYAQDYQGYWQGTIDISGRRLTMGFEISKMAEGQYTATLDVIEQAAKGIPAQIVADGASLKIVIPSLNASYDGLLLKKVINGKFRQSGLEFPLTLAIAEKPKPNRPQMPVAPFPYKAEEVSFTNTIQGNKLSGTLTYPEGKGPFKAVVLVSGSGTQDRDETMLDHKPFLVIADYLARNGIAALRYDDRGSGKSEAVSTPSTSMDLSFDTQAAVEYLRTRPEIAEIGIIGHSEGGVIELMVAERTKIDFLISLAGPCIKGTDLLLAQQSAINRAQGAPEETVKFVENINREAFKFIEESKEADESLKKSLQDLFLKAGLSQTQADMTIAQYTEPWMYYFLKNDPRPYIDKVVVPMLVINGTKDLQVVSTLNLASLRDQVKDRNNFTIVEPEGLNHLFQHCKTGSTSEYYSIEETFSPDILKLIFNWIELK